MYSMQTQLASTHHLLVIQVCSGQGDHKKAVQYFKMAATEEPNEKVNMTAQLSTGRADLFSVLCLLCV